MADSYIPGTGKVYHENLKLGKILQCMPDLPEFEFIQHPVCIDIQSKGMSRWTDLHNLLHDAGYCLDSEIHAQSQSSLCLTKFTQKAVLNLLKAQSDLQCFYKEKQAPIF